MPKIDIQAVGLIDDDPDIRRLGALALQNVGGWQVVVCEDATEARDMLPNAAVDVLLVDVLLGEDDGVVLLSELRAKGVTAPAIFLTGRADAEARARYDAAGAAGVIAKPFDPLGLADAVRHVLEVAP